MYSSKEIELSKRYLGEIIESIDHDLCLLGGWAVYDLVNINYMDDVGREYIGSRDIDLGFHIDKNWTDEQLTTSIFSRIIEILEKKGFQWQAFRLFKDFDIETLKELTIDEANKKSQFEITRMYIDPIIDYLHPRFTCVFGYNPIDEPILYDAYEKNLFIESNISKKIKICEPHYLLSMKLNCVERRHKEDKKIKDIADIYALMWYSGIDLDMLKIGTNIIFGKDNTLKVLNNFHENDVKKAAEILDINNNDIIRVFNEFKK